MPRKIYLSKFAQCDEARERRKTSGEYFIEHQIAHPLGESGARGEELMTCPKMASPMTLKQNNKRADALRFHVAHQLSPCLLNLWLSARPTCGLSWGAKVCINPQVGRTWMVVCLTGVNGKSAQSV